MRCENGRAGDYACSGVALSGLYWQLFSMKDRLSHDIVELNQRLSGDIAALSERLARDETHLEYIVPRLADQASEQSPGD